MILPSTFVVAATSGPILFPGSLTEFTLLLHSGLEAPLLLWQRPWLPLQLLRFQAFQTPGFPTLNVSRFVTHLTHSVCLTLVKSPDPRSPSQSTVPLLVCLACSHGHSSW